MGNSRTYTFSLIVGLLGVFSLGVFCGTLVTRHLRTRQITQLPLPEASRGANTIMARRFQAINQALREGRRDYEFQMSYLPPLSGKN